MKVTRIARGAVVRLSVISAVVVVFSSVSATAQQAGSAQTDVPGVRAPQSLPLPSLMSTSLSGTVGTAPPGGVTLTLPARLFRDGVARPGCNSPTTLPPASVAGSFLGNVHNFTNATAVAACVRISLVVLAPDANLQVAAFQSPFVAANVQSLAGFLGHPGLSSGIPPAVTSFEMTIPASATIAIVVFSSNTAPAGTGANYRVDVIEDCRTANCPPADFDRDRRTDLSIFRPAGGEWWQRRSLDDSISVTPFGGSTDVLVPADYNGNDTADIAVWRPSTGNWFILEGGALVAVPFGAAGDIPAPGDFDGDGRADQAVFRPGDGTWYINKSSGGFTFQPFGGSGDLPVAADYDGDGKTDIAIFRPSAGQWWILKSTGGLQFASLGVSNDRAVPGDYTGDGKADVAIWRQSAGMWFVLRSEDPTTFVGGFLGQLGDVPVPGDYDGDGKFDLGVFRSSSGAWFVNRSVAGLLTVFFGASTDIPVPSAFVR